MYWTNTTMLPLAQRGVIRVLVDQDEEDAGIIAELHAIQYLLEIVEVAGENRAGDKNLTLIVSYGAIRKLARMGSDKRKLSDHALFLTTRFNGSNITVDKNDKWIKPESEASITLDSAEMFEETFPIKGVGKVRVTAHVVEQFAERFGMPFTGEAWRKLMKIASDERIHEVDSTSARKRLKYELKGRNEGRYFHHPTQDAILVVVNDKLGGEPVLVTTYKSA